MQYVISNDTSRAVLIQETQPYVGKARGRGVRGGITADMAEVVTEVEGVGEGVANSRPNKDLASWSWSCTSNHICSCVPIPVLVYDIGLSVRR